MPEKYKGIFARQFANPAFTPYYENQDELEYTIDAGELESVMPKEEHSLTIIFCHTTLTQKPFWE